MKKKLMIILAAAFLAGNTGMYAQVVNTDVPTEETDDFMEEDDDEDELDEEEDGQEVLSEDEFAVTDE